MFMRRGLKALVIFNAFVFAFPTPAYACSLCRLYTQASGGTVASALHPFVMGFVLPIFVGILFIGFTFHERYQLPEDTLSEPTADFNLRTNA